MTPQIGPAWSGFSIPDGRVFLLTVFGAVDLWVLCFFIWRRAWRNGFMFLKNLAVRESF